MILGYSLIAHATWQYFLTKELVELLVSLAADLFDFEVGPWPTSLCNRIGDNSRYRFAGRDWFFRCIAFDIGAIETVEIEPWMQRRISVHKNTSWQDVPVVKPGCLASTSGISFIQSPSRRRDSPLGIETAFSPGIS
jgi:hypothetical protein